MRPQRGLLTLAKNTNLRLSFVSRFGWWEIGEIGHLCYPVSQESGHAGVFLGEPVSYDAGQHSESQPAPGPNYGVTHKIPKFPKKMD